MTLGIDAIALAVPAGYVDLADLAAARGVAPGKYIDGLGVRRMAVADAHEDPVALAANAARRLFLTSGRSPSDIGLCVVGTETAVDHSKPIAAYLHRLVGLPERCRVYEAKHACFGGTAGLLTALDWIASGSARGKSALIVCTDVARYEVGSAGEPTQGAGAVALLVSPNPRLLALEVGTTGSFARDVHDFWRPLDRKDAVVDGHYSVSCYLEALGGAYQAWQDAVAEAQAAGAEGFDRPLARTCYHVPYGKMARKAHRYRLSLEGVSEAEADMRYATEIVPSLLLPSLVGNIYTGSLYLALASLLHQEAAVLEGERIGLFSYGSGCAAEFFAGRVVPGAGQMMAQLDLAAPLETRHALSIPRYEAIRRGDSEGDRRPLGSMIPPATDKVAFLGIEGDRRVYGN